MPFFPAVLLALLAIPLIFASTSSSSNYHTVYQFEDGTFLENIAVRSNGDLLLTSPVKPIVYTLNPHSLYPSPSIIFEFPNATGTTGIAEVYPDVFAVVAGVLNPQNATTEKGSLCLWTVDVGHHEPVGKKVACVPESTGLNGATTLAGAPGTVLVSNSRLGGIYSINVHTGEVVLVVQDSLLEGTPENALGLGINGLRTHGHTVYFANSSKTFFGSIQLTSTVQTVGSIKTIATVPDGSNFTAYDDFALDGKGNAWITLHSHALVVVTPSGEQRIVLGGDGNTFLADPTSAAFGRGAKGGKETLYVVTGGIGISGGQIIAVDY
ncbi:hypothetical protein DL96DRAFT_1742436 [Flagelloscypha sp. PMI_526]|nr:hypothetical protein DL96DRAFT_1742436 [Flagelloscypha sp. PMI_526]